MDRNCIYCQLPPSPDRPFKPGSVSCMRCVSLSRGRPRNGGSVARSWIRKAAAELGVGNERYPILVTDKEDHFYCLTRALCGNRKHHRGGCVGLANYCNSARRNWRYPNLLFAHSHSPIMYVSLSSLRYWDTVAHELAHLMGALRHGTKKFAAFERRAQDALGRVKHQYYKTRPRSVSDASKPWWA